MTPKVKGFAAGSIAAASYGLNPLFALPLYREGLSVDSVLFFRYAFAIGLMALLLRRQRMDMRVRRREWPLLALYGLLFSASSLFLFLSYNYMDAGIASTILFMYPVMVALIMALFFGERASWLTWLCIVLAVGGVSLLTKTSDGSTVSLLGITFVLLSSLSYAIYIVGVNRSSIARMPSAKLTFYALCFGILIYIVRTRGLTELQLPHTVLGWTCAFCLALFPTIISLVTMTISIRNIGSTSAAILGALEPITALLVGTLVFGERLTPRLCVGIALVLLAVTLLIAGKKIYYTLRALLQKGVPCLFIGLCLSSLVPPAVCAQKTDSAGCPMEEVAVERLPDLHVPRAGHSTLCLNGELTVIGGHTSGFVPTATAEYFADGEWHLLETVYSHDHGFSLLTRSGRVLLGGGHEKPLGIGQVHHVEWYDPVAHTFEGFGCMDTRRVFASAAELTDGQAVISGNWYHDDNMELFDGQSAFALARQVTLPRGYPYIFPTSDGDAIILGTLGSRNENYGFPTQVDRLRGEPFEAPLQAHWHPLCGDVEHRSADSFIGRTAQGQCAYLMLVENAEQQFGLALVCDTLLTLLPTRVPVPKVTPWGVIAYNPVLVVDRARCRAYFQGHGQDRRFYVVAFDYSSLLTDGVVCPQPEGAPGLPLTLYYTSPLEEIGRSLPCLMDDGSLALVGGGMKSNFAPVAAAYLLHFSSSASPSVAASPLWRSSLFWGALLFVLLGCGLFVGMRLRKTASATSASSESLETAESVVEGVEMTENTLMQRIGRLMEDEQLYLQDDLKVQDLATRLDVSRRMVSETIAGSSGYASFAQFVNAYRVEHAKRLMRQHPEKKMAAVGLESGFANETSFFRTFKSFTDMTPREWVQQTL